MPNAKQKITETDWSAVYKGEAAPPEQVEVPEFDVDGDRSNGYDGFAVYGDDSPGDVAWRNEHERVFDEEAAHYDLEGHLLAYRTTTGWTMVS